MKKNITINLCGRLFAIDEDAYEMLSTYEKSLHNYFRSHDGGEEISEDIEARIAELFDELKQQGIVAVTIEQVTEIIHRIGKPEEMDEPSPDGSTAPPPYNEERGHQTRTKDDATQSHTESSIAGGSMSAKRLYRNPADKKMMGVLSGFAAYFGGDPLWWRLGFVGLVLMAWVIPWIMPISIVRYIILGHTVVYEDGAVLNSLLFIFIYVVLAVLMPVAETPEDRLRMKGKEVNPQNLAEEITSSSPTPSPKGDENKYIKSEKQTSTDSTSSSTGKAGEAWGTGHRGPSGCVGGTIGCIGGFFAAIWAVISTLFRWCIYAFGAFVALMCLVGIFMLFVVAFSPTESVFSSSFMESQEFAALLPTLKVPFTVFLIAADIVLAITAYAIIHSLLNEFKQMPSMPYRQRIALLVMWIAGVITACSALGSRWLAFIDAENDYYHRVQDERDARDREMNIHDGIYIQPHEWEFLQAGGWRILNAEGCNDRFTAHGEYLLDGHDERYIDCYDQQHRQRLRVERADTLQPGSYRLSCIARANGTGAFIYAIVGDQQPQFKEIPATGNKGGDIYEEMHKKYVLDREEPESDDWSYINSVLHANKNQGFGWNRITFDPIRITKPTVLRYGLTSDNAFTHGTWLGQYFSATDFEVSNSLL